MWQSSHNASIKALIPMVSNRAAVSPFAEEAMVLRNRTIAPANILLFRDALFAGHV